MGVSDDLTTAAGTRGRTATGGDRALQGPRQHHRRPAAARRRGAARRRRRPRWPARPGSGRRTAPAARARSSSSPTRSTTPRCGPTPRTRASAPPGATDVANVPFSGGVHAPGRARIAARTLREDRWWLQPLRHVRLLHRLAALRPGPGQPAEGLLRRRLRLPHAVRLALPVARPACPGRRTSARRSASCRPLIPFADPDPAVPAALPADLLLLPQGLLPLVLELRRPPARCPRRTASTPARPASR